MIRWTAPVGRRRKARKPVPSILRQIWRTLIAHHHRRRILLRSYAQACQFHPIVAVSIDSQRARLRQGNQMNSRVGKYWERPVSVAWPPGRYFFQGKYSGSSSQPHILPFGKCRPLRKCTNTAKVGSRSTGGSSYGTAAAVGTSRFERLFNERHSGSSSRVSGLPLALRQGLSL